MTMEGIKRLSTIMVLSWISNWVSSASEGQSLFGIHMCREKCLSTKACEYLSYSCSTLACYLQTDVIPSFVYDIQKIDIIKADMIHTDVKCNPRDRILRTRKNFLRCVSGVKSRVKSTRTKVKAKRLLLCPWLSQEEVHISQVDLQQDQLETQPYRPLVLTEVYALLFHRTTKSLYIGYYDNGKYFVSVSKLGSYKKRVTRVEIFELMVLDEERGWILTCKQRFDGVFKMVGKKQTRMFNYKQMKVSSMTVSSQNEIIYIAGSRSIYSFTYSGKMDVVVRTQGVGILRLDPQGKYLYYDVFKFISRYDTVTKTPVRFLHMPNPLEDIVVDSFSLYVKAKKASITVHELSTKKRSGSIYIKDLNLYILCLVI